MVSNGKKDDGQKEPRSRLVIAILSIIVTLITLSVTSFLAIYTLDYNKKSTKEIEEFRNDLLNSSKVKFEINSISLSHSYNGNKEGTVEILNTSKYQATNVDICIALEEIEQYPWKEVIRSISDIGITTYPASLNPMITEANVGTRTGFTVLGNDNINNGYMIHVDYIPPNSALRVELKKPLVVDSIDSCLAFSEFRVMSNDKSILSPQTLVDVILSTLETQFEVATFSLSVNSENSLDVEEGWTNLYSFYWFPSLYSIDMYAKRSANTWENTIEYILFYPKGSEMQESSINFDVTIEPDYESDKGYRIISTKTY